MATKKFSHMGLNCNNPVKIEKFYTRHFGFERARVYSPGPDQVVMIKSGDFYLELFKTGSKSPIPPPENDGYTFTGWRHMAFLVDNLDETLKELGDEAVISLGPLNMSEFIPGMRVAWVKDPEGNIIELNQGYVDVKNPLPLR